LVEPRKLVSALASQAGPFRCASPTAVRPFAERAENKPAVESEVDAFADEFLIPKPEMEGFVCRVRPYFSEEAILGFASKIRVHPGIVVGQLQFRRLIPYARGRDMLVRVRDTVLKSAPVDGWGRVGSPAAASRRSLGAKVGTISS